MPARHFTSQNPALALKSQADPGVRPSVQCLTVFCSHTISAGTWCGWAVRGFSSGFGQILQELFKLVQVHADFMMTLLVNS